MPSPVRYAVILAAGQGIRLGGRGLNGPKALLAVGGRTLLSRSLELLAAAGITRVLLVTGYKAEAFEKGLEAPPGLAIEKLPNPDFKDFGSLLSLVVALRRVREPCLILDGDILYEPRALRIALDHRAENVMVLSSPTGSGDEYYAWTDGQSRLLLQSKDASAMAQAPAGESVGILKCGTALRGAILAEAQTLLQGSVPADYEWAVGAAGRSHPIICAKAEGLLWAEVDNETMLAHAREVIYPRIAAAEARVSGLLPA